MNLTVTLLAISGLSLAVAVHSHDASSDLLSREDLRTHFEQFKNKFDKTYQDSDDELRRLDIFVENVNEIAAHNREADLGVHQFRLAVNQFADMKNEEFAQMMNGFRGAVSDSERTGDKYRSTSAGPLPDAVDWREKNLVTPVKNQKQCGSCWAFSAVAGLEGQHSKAAGKLVSLSEQNLVDCSGKEGNEGCEGGLMDQAFKYVKDVGGLDTEAAYPYKGEDEKCEFNKANIGATLKSWVDIPPKNETALQEAIAAQGPISVAIDASSFFFQFYSSGVLWDPLCSSTKLDHGVTAVGYGADDNGKKYYIVKNSWGVTWGQKGYIWMPRDAENKCGIATQASYPVV